MVCRGVDNGQGGFVVVCGRALENDSISRLHGDRIYNSLCAGHDEIRGQ